MTYRKKLIEVALPLEAINAESAREKSIRHGHPSTLHLWWARRPLAACRAVLFASLVDDPSSLPEQFPTEESQEVERQRLFRIIERLVLWENVNDEVVLGEARQEILRSTGGNPPPVLDPFCGGGSIPLEAQRLGLKAYGSDLNPVAVLITKALIEIPPKFAGKPPVHPVQDKKMFQTVWKGAQGLAEDVRYYGQWMRDEAEKRIGHLYPKVKLPKEHGGGEATVIAWLWTRTVKCPNPACGATMPLVRSFALSTKKGRQAFVQPIVDHKTKSVRFEVKNGEAKAPEGTVNRRGARCLVCDQPVPFDHVRAEGRAGRMGAQLMAIVAESPHGRVYVSPKSVHESIARSADPQDVPDTDLPEKALSFRVQVYGMTKHRDLFTPRQLVALTTLSDLVSEVRERILQDASKSGMIENSMSLADGGIDTAAYADAVITYLGLAVSRSANTLCSLAVWSQSRDQSVNVFSRHALPMNWDFPEVNPFAGAAGDFGETSASMSKGIAILPATVKAVVHQRDATAQGAFVQQSMISTDPPYYDNIGYADLSDFFYVWLRRSLGKRYPDVFSTLLVPKAQELVATPYRFEGDKKRAQQFFEEGLNRAFMQMRASQNSDYPVTVYYAFKQAEEDEDPDNTGSSAAVASTGWETMLEALLQNGFAIGGTWPMRTERPTGVKVAVNVLASSIVIVCRPRPDNAPLATRRELVAALKKELPDALRKLQHGNIAPVDLAQATIGPGMAIFSRYAKVLEADGNTMSVRSALQIINQELDAYLVAQEGEMDKDTRFCLSWFEQRGMDEGPFGEADVLARAKNTAVQGLVDAGVVHSHAGKVRLLKRDEYSGDWDPIKDRRLTVWECAQYLIKALNDGGEEAAARLVNRLGGGRSEDARALAYRLYSICERKKWADEALAYNMLVVSWPAIQDKAAQIASQPIEQGKLFE